MPEGDDTRQDPQRIPAGAFDAVPIWRVHSPVQPFGFGKWEGWVTLHSLQMRDERGLKADKKANLPQFQAAVISCE